MLYKKIKEYVPWSLTDFTLNPSTVPYKWLDLEPLFKLCGLRGFTHR